MFGVFSNHPDLRRILVTDSRAIPLRKDFPSADTSSAATTTITPSLVYEPVELAQEYRKFDLAAPWNSSQL